jgi:hypothetical protein
MTSNQSFALGGESICRLNRARLYGVERMVPEKLSRPWLTLGVRLTVFPVEAWTAPADLWEQVVGAPPETDQNLPRQGVRVQTGPWRDGGLQLTVSSDRFVWLAGPSPAPGGLPDFDHWSVESVLPEFLEVTRPWLNSVDFGIKRIGFGLNSLISVQDRAAAYRLLAELVPSLRLVRPDTTTDLLFQINRPVSSGALGGGLRLNRLMKWSALFLARTEVQVTPQGAQTGPVLGRLYASLDNDVNTPAELSKRFEKEQLGVTYDELVQLAWENLEAGELAGEDQEGGERA